MSNSYFAFWLVAAFFVGFKLGCFIQGKIDKRRTEAHP